MCVERAGSCENGALNLENGDVQSANCVVLPALRVTGNFKRRIPVDCPFSAISPPLYNGRCHTPSMPDVDVSCIARCPRHNIGNGYFICTHLALASGAHCAQTRKHKEAQISANTANIKAMSNIQRRRGRSSFCGKQNISKKPAGARA